MSVIARNSSKKIILYYELYVRLHETDAALAETGNLQVIVRGGSPAISLVKRAMSLARYLIDRARMAIAGMQSSAGGRVQPVRVILISDGCSATSDEQFRPFHSYRAELRKSLGLISLHLLASDIERAPKLILSHFDVVILKLSFLTSTQDAARIVAAIKGAITNQRFVYFDGDDDLCVRLPEVVSDVDAYVKGHLFRDRQQYLNRFVGKSNLTDFVHKQFGVSFADDPCALEAVPVPFEQISKIALGCNLAVGGPIERIREKISTYPAVAKDIDIVFRGNVPADWMGHLRKGVAPALKRLQKTCRVIVPDTRVNPEEYYREMLRSKICVSPFGYGEVCWRDFEAVICGCLLVKPDMSHIETHPNIYRPYETYVPVKWDFSDLEEKCVRYLANERERQRITAAARKILDDFYENRGFLKSTAQLLDRISIN